ncbi:META domain-containing protein [Acidimicrobiia bacterium EGI L10123]|uniref:META domain-containing protein n=1 Tax=Salinilacustrithrix flava TaxID=2957203 RepID=UPI003D7C1EA5|nr:META domain-containing protein [Acidimicrobiia bacterium EGI L10123]
MTLEDRLERLADRTPPGNPADVLDAARIRAESRPASRSPRLLAAAAAVLAVLALAGGGLTLAGDDSDSVTVAGPDESQTGDELNGLWHVVSTVDDGERQPAEGTANLRFDGDRVQGDDGCGNKIETALDKGTIVVPSVRTDQGCESVPGAREADRLWALLGQPVELRDGELWLVADDGDGLVFALPDPTPTERASPVGDWELVSVSADGEVLDFSGANRDPWIGIGGDGTLTGTFPCNGFGGTVQVLDSTLDAEFFQELVGCEGSAGAAESALSRLLNSDPTWEIRDGALFLSAAGIDAELTKRPGPTDVVDAGSQWRPVAIDAFEVLDDTSLNLTLGYCTDDYRVRVDESDDTVTLTAEAAGPSGGYCLTLTTVELRRPLGNRAVVDAFTGETVDRRPTDAPAGAEGDTAVWNVDAADPPTPSATSVTALVTRLGCSGGETGEVLAPVVSADAERVVVTFSVESLPPEGEYECPGNPAVPYVVELDEPLGDRELVDGACLEGEAASTSHCSEGAVRWSPPA